MNWLGSTAVFKIISKTRERGDRDFEQEFNDRAGFEAFSLFHFSLFLAVFVFSQKIFKDPSTGAVRYLLLLASGWPDSGVIIRPICRENN